MKHLYFLSIVLFSLSATAQLKDCATCATQVIKEQQIRKLSIDELRFLTNDLYARKGYKFKDYEISNYFNEKPWYKPVTENSKVKLNAVEEQNYITFTFLELKIVECGASCHPCYQGRQIFLQVAIYMV